MVFLQGTDSLENTSENGTSKNMSRRKLVAGSNCVKYRQVLAIPLWEC